jgi:hypothetical protein
MTGRISSLFQDALQPLRLGEERLSGAELMSELVPLTYTLSEGDISVDLMRRYCHSAGLDLRGDFGNDHWYDIVGEVNIGINLYYVIEDGRLWQMIEWRERRKATITPLVSHLTGALAGPRPTETSPDVGAPNVVRRVPNLPAPRSVQSFLGEAKARELLPTAVFARYLGRVLSNWLDCGPADRPFPQITSELGAKGHDRGAVRVAGAIATTADISLSPPQIHDAWSGEDAPAMTG